MYALIDCNSFFASCEQIFRPDLRDQPVVVLSNNDGCIVARSKEAKALAIPDLQAYFKIRKHLDQQGVHVFSSNYELYGDISRRVVDILHEFAADVEVYSIDESFLQLDGLQQDYYAYGQRIKNTLWRDVRMPVCAGFGKTKTLAKLANHIAKKSVKLQGVCVLDDLAAWQAVFRKLPAGKVWGIGSRLEKKLALLGVHTVQDLMTASPSQLRKHFSVHLERTIRELNGERCIADEWQPVSKKQIYSTRSFGAKVHTLAALQQAVSQYTTRAAVKLRKQQSLVKTLHVFIETSRFDTHPYKNSLTIALDYPTNDTGMIIGAAKRGIKSIYREGFRYAKAGVGLIELLDATPLQCHLFDKEQSQKSANLMRVIDQLNKQKPQVFFAGSGINPFWQMQRKKRSPAYTTRLQDIPVVKA